MLTRAELEYLVRMPNELHQINETLKQLVELLKQLSELCGTLKQ